VEDPLQDTVDTLLPLLGVDRGRRVRRVRHAEQVEDERQHLTEALVHQEQPAGDPCAGRLGTVAIPDLVEGAPHLQYGEHRDRLPVRDAASLEDRDPARATALDELGAQARLADARLGDDANHLTAAAARALESGDERGHFTVAPDERGEPAGPRAIETGAERPHGLEIEEPDRLTHALDRNPAQILELEVPLDEPRRVLRETDVPRLGERLHALREADDVSVGRELHVQVVADSPDYDLARVEPDADRERHAVLGADLARVRAGGVTQTERRVAGALRVILVGDRRAEERHAAVPGELVDEPLEALDAVAEDAEEALHDLRPRLGVELLRQLHRALHVGEEDGDLLALALDRGFRLADLLGEERRMGWRWSRRPPADRQRRAAAAAEFLADLDRGAAGGTPHGQFGAALRAEATVG
jgi:hypothetical protein